MVSYERVGAFPSRTMAELAVTYLSANGIHAVVTADDGGGAYPHVAMGAGGISLRVPAEDADAARELLDEAARQPVLPDEDEILAARPWRPGGTWVIRVAAVAVVSGILIAELASR